MNKWLRLFFPVIMYADDPAGGGGGGDPAGGGGNPAGGGDWFASLPAEYQSEASLANFKGKPLPEFVKSHVELRKKLGSNKMQDMDAPTDDAGKQAVFAKLGHVRPAKPEDYGLKFPDGFKGQRDEAKLQEFQKQAHELGLTKDQAARMLEHGLKSASEAHDKLVKSTEDAKKRTEETFRKEWGADYETNKAHSERAWAENIKDPKMREALETLGVHLNPDLVRVFAKVGKISQEGYMWNGSGNGGGASAGDLAGRRAALAKFESENKAFLTSVNGLNPEVNAKKTEWNKLRDSVSELEIAAEKQGAA